MPQLYSDSTEKEIRARFIQKCSNLIASGRASYKDICDRIQIPTTSFNQVKSGMAMPTVKMLYNLQVVFKVPAEGIIIPGSVQGKC